jgi:hypothetical protein
LTLARLAKRSGHLFVVTTGLSRTTILSRVSFQRG